MGSSGLVESGSGRARGRSSRARGPGPRVLPQLTVGVLSLTYLHARVWAVV